MKFEKLNTSNRKGKTIFLSGLVMGVALIIVINFFMSYAKYKVVDSVKLASGTVSYENADFSLIALYIQNGDKENPSDGYKKIEDGNVPQKDVKLMKIKLCVQ